MDGLKKDLTKFLGALALTAVAGCSGLGSPSDATRSQTSQEEAELTALVRVPYSDICRTAKVPGARCYAKIRSDVIGAAAPQATTPAPLGAQDLQKLYNVPATPVVAAPVVALIEAGDYPNLESDLAAYRTKYGLPACTQANGCLTIVGQDGSANLPAPDMQWAVETALDVDMVSAACPTCKILVIESDESDNAGLLTANTTAASMGATTVSNSWGINEDIDASQFDQVSQQFLQQLFSGGYEDVFSHSGIAYFAASGDVGYGTTYPAGSGYPATSPLVTAVGGTVATPSSHSPRGWVEGTWGEANDATDGNGGTGSGCSSYFPKPAWQKDTACAKRMANDVAAIAGAPGVEIYIVGGQYTDSNGDVQTLPDGFNPMGGTSAASPLIAAIYAVTGNGSQGPNLSYVQTDAFYDVTSGTNGICSGGESYFCTAKAGYDGPTGNGTPNGAALASIANGGTTTTDPNALVSFRVDSAQTAGQSALRGR